MTVVGAADRPASPEARFNALFARHYPAVYGYAVRRVGRDEAGDAAAEVFTVAWRRLGRVPAEPETLPWLYGVARRVVANQERAARRRLRLEARAAASPRRRRRGSRHRRRRGRGRPAAPRDGRSGGAAPRRLGGTAARRDRRRPGLLGQRRRRPPPPRPAAPRRGTAIGRPAMNRDPFDTLRSRNPAPPEGLPEAPMPLASRITAGRPSLRRGLAIATAAAAVVLVAGGGWLLWSGAAPESVGARHRPTDADHRCRYHHHDAFLHRRRLRGRRQLVVYFLITRQGLARAGCPRPPRAQRAAPCPTWGPSPWSCCSAGPGAWDAGTLPDPVAAAEAGLTSAIPEGTRLLSLSGGRRRRHRGLSRPSSPARLAQAIAQVVYTLTRPARASPRSASSSGRALRRRSSAA